VRLSLACLLAVSCARTALPNTHTWGHRHGLAKERCGWVIDAVLEDYGPVGILRARDGHASCMVWFTPGGTAPHRELLDNEKPLRIVKLPREELPAVLSRRRESLVLIRPSVGAQRIELIADSPSHTVIGPPPRCTRVSLRAHLCADNLWTEEEACVGEAAVRRFRRWEPNTPSAYHTQAEPPGCPSSDLWFEAEAAPQAPPPVALQPPGAPPAVESATLLGLYTGSRVTAVAAFDVRRPDLDGGTERDLDLHVRFAGATQWQRHASVTLERGPPAGGCVTAATVNEDGSATLVTCVDGRRAPVDVQAPVNEQNLEPGCQRTPAGIVCLQTAKDGTAVGWSMADPYGARRGIPAIRGLRLADGPFFEGDHLRFVGKDAAGALRWVRAPLPRAPADLLGQRWLDPILGAGGMTTGVFTLKQGPVLVTRSSCSEFGGPLPGVILFPKGPPLRVDSGPAIDLGRHAVLATEVTIGSDGSGEEPSRLPEGATFYEHSTSGAYLVRRLVAVDLESRTQRPQPWGSHSPRTAGARRFVVFAKALDAEGSRHEVYAWNVAAGTARLLGAARGAYRARVERDEVWVELESGVVAVSGTTGTSRALSGARPVVADALAFAPPLPVGPQPPFWQTPEGDAVIAGGSLPMTGGCGVEGVHWVYGALVADQGVFVWPRELKLIDFEVPR